MGQAGSEDKEKTEYGAGVSANALPTPQFAGTPAATAISSWDLEPPRLGWGGVGEAGSWGGGVALGPPGAARAEVAPPGAER